MIWLITQSAGWLLLTMAFAALAGWAWASERAAPAQRGLRRQRETLVRDLARLGAGELAGDGVERERQSEAGRRLIEIRDGRIAELERQLAAARGRADDAASRLAEIERRGASLPLVSEAAVDVPAAPVEDEAKNLQAWRLRYFEQRVRYLEGLAPAAAPAPELEWRAREAEARAAHLESEVRALSAPGEPEQKAESEPFAANAEVDMALRWRMLYLEKRVAHLQSELAARPEPIAAPAEDASPDPEVWKWRSRYLEARVRHLEQAPPAAAMNLADAPAAEAPPAPQTARGVKPPVLSSARNGLPDDFTLIEGVSGLQQSTLNALGVFHFDQIAAWTPEHVAWVDRYLYLRGRIEEEEWVEQAADLAREGVSASRRALAEEDA